MNELFTYMRRKKGDILEKFGDPLSFCTALTSGIDETAFPINLQELLSNAEPDDRDYAISSAYALLMGSDRRKALSAYFTPPGLAAAVLDAASGFLEATENPTVLDPACGGGSFLTPVARHLISMKCRHGASAPEACARALQQMTGVEIDAGLAKLSEKLLRRMLEREYAVTRKGPLGVVKCGDALSVSLRGTFDLVIGNPPYGRVRNRIEESILKAYGRANLGGHTNLYSLFLLRSLEWVKPGGGLVFVLPTSFVAGPYFAGVRHEVFSRAVVKKIDLHEQRENLFLGAVQDICLLVLQRREESGVTTTDKPHPYELGYIDACGVRSRRGTGLARGNGEPWTLPVSHEVGITAEWRIGERGKESTPFTLSDYGYRVRVGKVVPTRERDRLHTSRRTGDLPLVWASSIRPDGSFDFEAAKRLGNALWYSPETEGSAGYTSTRPAVLVQRTSNRDQCRRLNAAMIPNRFRSEHRDGFVAENHVIVIEVGAGKPSVPPSVLAKLLNAAVTNERFSAVSGSFSVSAKLLQRLALPDPALVRALKANHFEHGLRELFDGLGEVLVHATHSDSPRNTENSVNKPRNMDSSLTVDQDSGLERGALA